MFKIEKNNAKIGKYLAELIDQRYASRRDFGRQYLIAAGDAEPTAESINNMSNRLAQIIKGKKAIQIYDLPYFTNMLGVSCEQILSAGECAVPVSGRVTNYSIACSKDPKEWEEYIQREDKLVLNADEYCKTVLDYAIEFRNHGFIRFLMDHNYIWFDSGNDRDYVMTFGAGTSIQHRHTGAVDCGLESQLHSADALRAELIALACDHDDIQMLQRLRAREIPQLYYQAHYLSGQHPDLDSHYNSRTVKHIAAASEYVLDYFTDSFGVRDHLSSRDGIQRTHTFMFPYISQLLDLLVSANSDFTETAIKKAIRHNEQTYARLCGLIRLVKNDPQYPEHLWIKVCQDGLDYFENGSIVMFRAIYSTATAKFHVDGIITNVPHITKMPAQPTIKHLVEELNALYLKIKNIAEHLEEI